MTVVGIISDIHLRKEHHDEIINTLLKIKEAYRCHHEISHTFVLGDLIQDASPDLDRTHLEQVHSVFDDWVSPVTYLLGNHDIGTLSKEDVTSILDQPRSYGTVHVDGHPFVYLDSTDKNIGARGTIGIDQRSWLENSLPSDAIVFSHHPLGPFSLGNNIWFDQYPERGHPWDRKETLKLLEGTTRATIGGHIHQQSQSQFKDMDHFSVNAVSKETPTNSVSGHFGMFSVGESVDLQWRCVLDSGN